MAVYGAPDIPDNVQKRETVLVDHRGRSILERAPRPIGFRPPAAKDKNSLAGDGPRPQYPEGDHD